MGVVAQGAPVFTIGGDPGGIATRAAVMMDRANEFAEIHSSLSSLKADGWTGRAANRFREKYKLQLKGWLDAQEAFSSASTAYSTYASTLQSAQSQCDEIRSRWEQGRRAVEQAQNNKADARSRAQAEGGIPMIDASCDEGPGRATMQGAEEDFQALVNEVNEAGNQLNSVLDAGISKLPERTWLNAIGRTAGSFALGVKDAVTDLFNLLFLGTPTLLNDFRRLITGGLTPEEFLVSYSDVPAEKLESFFTELSNNPKKFFEDAFYSLIDGETWADDPGRALGRLAPDIALTYATAGAAAAAKGLKGAARAAFIGRELVLSVTHISDVSDLVRASRRLAGRLARIGSDAASSLAGLGSHLPHSGTTPHPHVPTAPTSPTGHSGTPTMPSSGAPSYPSHGAPSMPSTGAPSYPSHGGPNSHTTIPATTTVEHPTCPARLPPVTATAATRGIRRTEESVRLIRTLDSPLRASRTTECPALHIPVRLVPPTRLRSTLLRLTSKTGPPAPPRPAPHRRHPALALPVLLPLLQVRMAPAVQPRQERVPLPLRRARMAPPAARHTTAWQAKVFQQPMAFPRGGASIPTSRVMVQATTSTRPPTGANRTTRVIGRIPTT